MPFSIEISLIRKNVSVIESKSQLVFGRPEVIISYPGHFEMRHVSDMILIVHENKVVGIYQFSILVMETKKSFCPETLSCSVFFLLYKIKAGRSFLPSGIT